KSERLQFRESLNLKGSWKGRGFKVSSTNPEEFKRFHFGLIRGAPAGYMPFYFPLEKGGKDPRENISWKNNRKTFREAYYLMRQGFNIGIAATSKDPL